MAKIQKDIGSARGNFGVAASAVSAAEQRDTMMVGVAEVAGEFYDQQLKRLGLEDDLKGSLLMAMRFQAEPHGAEHESSAAMRPDLVIKRDPKRVLECLQRSLKTADACMTSAQPPISLFVEILDHYLAHLEAGNPLITPSTSPASSP